ncbi:MAG: peptidoglycan DD-metalloendopeptidase family protein [Spirochaetaceae bacterium]|jgi:hypothetical protein|nr:peptidoglycan DD-metalloendopeptidase family protein [Spirochaetaceae bacterium]
MIRLFILLPLLCASALRAPAVFAIDWPSKDAVMISNFGASDIGRPALGDTFRAEGTLSAIEKGEIIFSGGATAPAARFTSPLGAMTVLDHGDGIMSIYSRIEAARPAPQNLVSAGEVIAKAGVSGWSKTNGFYLSIFDRKDRRWVNPSLVIPALPDTRPPVIRSVKLKNSENQMIDLAAVRVVKQGVYTIIVHAEDITDNVNPPLMPMRIICSVNGVEAGVLAFETFSARDGVLMMFRNGLMPVSQIYAYPPAVEAGVVFFSRGQVTLEIIVQDIAALLSSSTTQPDGSNSRRAFYRLFIE